MMKSETKNNSSRGARTALSVALTIGLLLASGPQHMAQDKPAAAAKPSVRNAYFPGTEELGPEEMRIISCGTGTPQPPLKQAAACFLYGVVSLPAAIVEPLIAASIVYVAVENILTPQLKPWRPLVVFGFGLLHGLGFAGVLQEIGLPRARMVPALLSFNIGVEIGQLAVIAAAFFAVGIWAHRRSWYRPRIAIPASAMIAVTGLIWTVQRVMASS